MRYIWKALVGAWVRMTGRQAAETGRLAAATLQTVSHRQMMLPGIGEERESFDFRLRE